MNQTKNLDHVLIEEMRELFEMESRLLRILPQMAEAAKDPGLKRAISRHWEQTKEQIDHLRQALDQAGATPGRKTPRAVAFHIAEQNEWSEGEHTEHAMDAQIICAAMKIEHYKTASYVNVCTFANLLGLEDVAVSLEAALGRNAPGFQPMASLLSSPGDDCRRAPGECHPEKSTCN